MHGQFLQTPSSHIVSKQGCPKCGLIRGHQNLLKNTGQVISEAKKKHKYRYDYSKAVYKGKHHKIEIICPIHGSFWQITKDHLNGFGCPKCSGRKRLTTKEFIEKAQQVHGTIYDYSLVEYASNKRKVKIVCPEHGAWMQRPNDHLTGYGCPSCGESKGEQQVANWLDKHAINYARQWVFDDCTYKAQLRFDFWLPAYNICIEYDGRQHFEPIEVWGGREAFELGQKRDEVKNQYCKENEIRLIRISYRQFNNIKLLLDDLILKGVDNEVE
jgi:predicted RNA-binding Zn-ribbon protein involved in translation (DUF1610 family)